MLPQWPDTHVLIITIIITSVTGTVIIIVITVINIILPVILHGHTIKQPYLLDERFCSTDS